MNKDIQAQAVLQMLESARLSSAEVDGLLNQAIDADYWRRFCPVLSVGSSGWREIREECPLDPSEVGRLAEKVRTEGYFQTSAVFPLPLVHRMRSCVELLRSQNWPPAFAFVFDEFWAILRTASLERLLSSFLGQGYRQNSAVWTYYVSTQKGSAGWAPHQDGGGEQRWSVWLPLTDATLDNGCMYVVPRNLLPDSLPAKYTKWDSVNQAELG
jgi:hypothetical protein